MPTGLAYCGTPADIPLPMRMLRARTCQSGHRFCMTLPFCRCGVRPPDSNPTSVLRQGLLRYPVGQRDILFLVTSSAGPVGQCPLTRMLRPTPSACAGQPPHQGRSHGHRQAYWIAALLGRIRPSATKRATCPRSAVQYGLGTHISVA